MQVEGYSLEAQKDRLTKFAQFQDMDPYCKLPLGSVTT